MADPPRAEHAPPPPPWVPAPAAPPAPPRARRRRAAPLLLVVGALLGAGAALAAARSTTPPAGGVTEVRVNGSPASAPGMAATTVAARLAPSVGTVIATLASGNGLGSGFVIGHNQQLSYLVTNNHVVAGNRQLHVVMPDGQEFTATLVGTDALYDIAVVSVPTATLPVATFGSSAHLTVGQEVIAIGSPLGNQGSVTVGVLSALHRTITARGQTSTSSETLEDVLQTDASINPGNSGGPLADSAGNVIGVNVATAGNATAIGYSIPADLARSVAEELIAHRPVGHPFLGVAYLDSVGAIESGTPFSGPGVYVRSVSSSTPAARAGFRAGDILVSVDGVAIDNGETLGGLLLEKRVGQTVACAVRRGARTLTLHATLVERPART